MDAASLNQLFYADSVCVCGPQEPRRKQFFLEKFNAHGKMMWYKVQVRVHLSGSPSMQKCEAELPKNSKVFGSRFQEGATANFCLSHLEIMFNGFLLLSG